MLKVLLQKGKLKRNYSKKVIINKPIKKEEKAFKMLMSKQKTILDKIIELEETHGDGVLSEEDYNKKLAAYKEHLVQVKVSLRQFIE